MNKLEILLEQLKDEELYGTYGEYVITITIESKKDNAFTMVEDASFEISGDEAVLDTYKSVKDLIEDRGGIPTGLEDAEGMEQSEAEYDDEADYGNPFGDITGQDDPYGDY